MMEKARPSSRTEGQIMIRWNAFQWREALGVYPFSLKVDLYASKHLEYWRCFDVPKDTKVVIQHSLVNFGRGECWYFPSSEAFVEFCEAPRTMSCTCGVCRAIAMIRVGRGLEGE